MVIQDGGGEAVEVKHGLFGNNSTVMQDRLGDKYVNKHGLFGTKDQGVSILGNGFEKKKGLLGGSSLQGSDLLGDQVVSKKSLLTLGRRTTYVNMGGAGSMVGQLIGRIKAPPGVPDNSVVNMNPGPAVQGAVPGPFEAANEKAPLPVEQPVGNLSTSAPFEGPH